MDRHRFTASIFTCWPFLAVMASEASLTVAAEVDVGADSEILLVYISALDCPPCHAWARRHRPVVERHPLRAQFDFRGVAAYMVRRTGDDAIWPDDLVWIRDQLGIRRGAPTWVIVVDGQIVWYSRRDATRPRWSKTWAALEELCRKKGALAAR